MEKTRLVADADLSFLKATLRADGYTEITETKQADGRWFVVAKKPVEAPGPAAPPVVAPPTAAPVVAPPPVGADDARPGADESDVDTLARTIWGEARGEPVSGMEAVASVVLNRLRRNRPRRFGRTVADVCTMPAQFSCWNEGDPNRAKLLRVDERDEKFREYLRIARAAVAGTLADSTGGADHYHVAGIEVGWAARRRPCCTVGKHLFFNDIP
jgi:N-acetylmuramoyl-L-alanine amidase